MLLSYRCVHIISAVPTTVTKIEKNMLKWFGLVERMDERRLTKEIYKAVLGGNAVGGKSRRTFSDQIGQVLEKG
jgi:hypothetical protein